MTSQISVATKTAQVAWIEKVQERLRATTSLLGDIKAIKMLALPQVASSLLTNLRTSEIKTSKTFRELLVATLILCMPFKFLLIYLQVQFLTTISSPHALKSRSFCDVCCLRDHIRLLDTWILFDNPSIYLPCSDRIIDGPRHNVHPVLTPGSAMRGQF